jgi:hypothetical protein
MSLTTGKPFPNTVWEEFVQNESGNVGQYLALAMPKTKRD